MLNKKVQTRGKEEVVFEVMGGVLVGAFHPNTIYTCTEDKANKYRFVEEGNGAIHHLTIDKQEFEKIKSQLIIE